MQIFGQQRSGWLIRPYPGLFKVPRRYSICEKWFNGNDLREVLKKFPILPDFYVKKKH